MAPKTTIGNKYLINNTGWIALETIIPRIDVPAKDHKPKIAIFTFESYSQKQITFCLSQKENLGNFSLELPRSFRHCFSMGFTVN